MYVNVVFAVPKTPSAVKTFVLSRSLSRAAPSGVSTQLVVVQLQRVGAVAAELDAGDVDLEELDLRLRVVVDGRLEPRVGEVDEDLEVGRPSPGGTPSRLMNCRPPRVGRVAGEEGALVERAAGDRQGGRELEGARGRSCRACRAATGSGRMPAPRSVRPSAGVGDRGRVPPVTLRMGAAAAGVAVATRAAPATAATATSHDAGLRIRQSTHVGPPSRPELGQGGRCQGSARRPSRASGDALYRMVYTAVRTCPYSPVTLPQCPRTMTVGS